MLPPFIIEQLREREERARRDSDREQPRLELPVRSAVIREPVTPETDEGRGIVEIQIW